IEQIDLVAIFRVGTVDHLGFCLQVSHGMILPYQSRQKSPKKRALRHKFPRGKWIKVRFIPRETISIPDTNEIDADVGLTKDRNAIGRRVERERLLTPGLAVV
ncbi:MAG: hypothetical protein ACRD3F_11695, partial [Acidobacteriaceae bacterium]